MIQITQYFFLVFGLLTLLGGLMGFLKAGSIASLVAGAICGALLDGAFVLILIGKVQAGLVLGLIVSLAMTGQFLPKLLRGDRKPHIVAMVVLCEVGTVLTLLTMYKP